MSTLFTLSSSPHVATRMTVPKVMRGVVYAYIPIVIVSIYFYNWRAVWLLTGCIASCVLSEALYQKVLKKPLTINDWSAVVTGMSLAFILPPGLPIWAAVIGSFFAMIIGKMVFGGLGFNIFNPSLLGRAFLMANFPVWLTTWIKPHSVDAITTATPLALQKFQGITTPLSDLFYGNVAGSLGETSVLAILIAAIYLFAFKIGDWRASVSTLLTVFVFSTILWIFNPASTASPLFHLYAGGLMFGVVFHISDPVTTPTTKRGRWIFGLGTGILIVTIRKWGGLPEGVMYSILLMNAVTPLINRWTRPKPFGWVK